MIGQIPLLSDVQAGDVDRALDCCPRWIAPEGWLEWEFGYAVKVFLRAEISFAVSGSG
jgi:hypothetical protein